MRVVVQRVSYARVVVDRETVSEINRGLLVLLGIESSDGEEDVSWLCKKIVKMRIFDDDKGVMNLSVKDVGGDIIVVSQFTLHAGTKKGNRPSYIKSANPELAKPIYQNFTRQISTCLGKAVGTGIFGAHMKVDLCNEGPVTIFIDSKQKT